MSGQVLVTGSTFSLSDGSPTVAVSAVQTLTITATGGTLVLGYGGGLAGAVTMKTAPITLPTTPAAVQATLVALPNIGNNRAGQPNVLAGGTAGAVTVQFQNDLASQSVPLLVVDPSSAVTGGTVTVAMTTPGTSAGGVYAAVAALTDMVFPNTKKDVKEVTNFDSVGYTKEYIGGFINPGDVGVNAMWKGDPTQDYTTGIIQKFYAGQPYNARTNVPHKISGVGLFTRGMAIGLSGFFTDGSPMGIKHDDILTIKGSIQISGLPLFGPPTQ